jgi:hypothetical protein
MLIQDNKKQGMLEKNEQLSKLIGSNKKLTEIIKRNKTERRVIKEDEIIRFPFIVVEYSGDKKSNVILINTD